MARKVNQSGIDLIMRFEGCKLKSYLCPAGVLTIGYGSTGAHVKKDMVITQDQADQLLLDDLAKFCNAVSDMVKVDINDNQFSALVSLCFNIGQGALAKSTLMKKLNASDFLGAAAQFDVWNKAGGKVLEGLCKRRAAERKLFES